MTLVQNVYIVNTQDFLFLIHKKRGAINVHVLLPVEKKAISLKAKGMEYKRIAEEIHKDVPYVNRLFDSDRSKSVYHKIEGVNNSSELLNLLSKLEMLEDMYPNILEELEETRRTGNANSVVITSDWEIFKLNNILYKNPEHLARRKILNILKHLLIANGLSLINIYSAHETNRHLKPIITQLHNISEELIDNEADAYCKLLISIQNYSNRDYHGAQIYANLSKKTGGIKDHYLRLMPDTLFTLSSGLRKERENILIGEDNFNEILKKNNSVSPINNFQNLRAVGGSLALVGENRGIDKLLECWEEYKKMSLESPFPLGAAMLAKSFLKIPNIIKSIGSQLIEKIGNEGLEKSKLHGLSSYEIFIEKQLKIVLN